MQPIFVTATGQALSGQSLRIRAEVLARAVTLPKPPQPAPRA